MLEGLWCKIFGVELNAGGLCPCFYYSGQDVLLLLGKSFYRVDQIWDEIGAPLILGLHIGPGGSHRFIFGDEAVVIALKKRINANSCNGKDDDHNQTFSHLLLLLKIENSNIHINFKHKF